MDEEEEEDEGGRHVWTVNRAASPEVNHSLSACQKGKVRGAPAHRAAAYLFYRVS